MEGNRLNSNIKRPKRECFKDMFVIKKYFFMLSKLAAIQSAEENHFTLSIWPSFVVT